MATAEKKAVRKALALDRLDGLAVQLGERLGVEVADLKLKGGDPELAQIQQMEATADLLESILKAAEPEPGHDQADAASDADTPEPVRKSARKAGRKGRR